jgi:hypothetical protein
MPRYLGIVLAASLNMAVAGGCAGQPDEQARRAEAEAAVQERTERAFDDALERITAYADAIDAVFQPLPLLRPAEAAALRRYTNQQQLAQARQLGVAPPPDAAALERLRQDGKLVPLAEANAFWVVRELDHSLSLVTPDVAALLAEVGARFHERLVRLGLPPLRLEITSALRTAAHQEDLRDVNPNAARGTSTHEYGTTVDVAYSSFRAPEQPVVAFDVAQAPWLAPYLHRYADALVETVAARRSRELQALLGHVLQELQDEGKVMVLMERLQPVYHMTVAQRF